MTANSFIVLFRKESPKIIEYMKNERHIDLSGVVEIIRYGYEPEHRGDRSVYWIEICGETLECFDDYSMECFTKQTAMAKIWCLYDFALLLKRAKDANQDK